ncbi:hypothetical protein GNP94_14680 [Paenibacillus campinasensis]|uniref:Uncharacterized protein n=1 Tax=Paenibacillus campinasensis TaxID=66347 RepID=A0ABW9T2C7_9BACL|nr:hypothetical protein [Paenibacillus campinasensis]MUG67232.1 hypothetical protein [Paenibacillus campinasensis]
MRSVDRVMQEGIVHLSLGAKRGCTIDRACGKVRESPPVAVKIGKRGTNVRRGSFPIIKANALLLRRFAPLYREAMCSRMSGHPVEAQSIKPGMWRKGRSRAFCGRARK